MKILFVCSTNICRSPYCEMYFRRLMRDNPEFARVVTDVKSAAVINFGKKLDDKAYACMKEEGFPEEWLDAHVSKHIWFNKQLFRDADVIVGMTRIHGALLPRAFRRKYVNLSEAADGIYKPIPDPFLAKSQEEYNNAMHVIAGYLDRYAAKLIEGAKNKQSR